MPTRRLTARAAIISGIMLSIVWQTANAAFVAPAVINSGNASILEGSFTNPNFTVTNNSTDNVMCCAINLITGATTGDDKTDFATGSIAKTGSCFAGFPMGPVTLKPKQSCDFDISVVADPLDPKETDKDTGITPFTAMVSWSAPVILTTTSSLMVEVRDPGAPSKIPEPGMVWVVGAGILLTVVLSHKRKGS